MDMKKFLSTHAIYHETQEEQKMVLEVAKRYYPQEDFDRWSDRHPARFYPYMTYYVKNKCFNMWTGCPYVDSGPGRKAVITVSDFLAIFDYEDEDDITNFEALCELV